MQFPALPSAKICGVIVAGFFAATFLVYGSSLDNEFVTWDDDALIVGNPIVAEMNATTVTKAFSSYDPELYIPFTFVSWQLDHLIGGFDPFIYHLGNLVLHTLSAVLVTWILFLMLQNGWLALGLGLLFALHPLNTETVAWASARKDVLAAFFYFSSVTAYMYAVGKDSKRLFWLSLVLFLFGLLSKVVVVTLPVALVLVDLFFDRRLSKKLLWEKVPFLALSVVFGIVALYGKTNQLAESTALQKFLLSSKSAVFYPIKFVWPADLSVLYPYAKIITVWSADFAVPLFVNACIAALIIYMWRRIRVIAIAILLYEITLFPTFFNLAKAGDLYTASDRYAYIPMFGLLLLAGILMTIWLDTAATDRSHRGRLHTLTAAGVLALIVSATMAATQATYWRDSIALFNRVLVLYPQSHIAHNNLGMVYLLQGRTDQAIDEFTVAYREKPLDKIVVNLAAAQAQKGNFSESQNMYERVISEDPTNADAVYGLANLYQKAGELDQAAKQYRKAIDIDPDYLNAYNNLGAVYLQLHDWQSAVSALEESVRRKPGFAESYYNLAIAYVQLHQDDRAIELFQKTISLSPSDADALANLATLLYGQKKVDEAAELLQRSLAIDSSNPTAVALVLRMKKDGLVR